MRPPRALLGVCLAVLVAAISMSFAGAVFSGVTADEPYHVQRFNNWAETGWYIADFQKVDGGPTPGTSDQYVYGPATTWLLHQWNRLLGTDEVGRATVSAEAYLTRHLGIVLISLIAVAATAALGRMLLRRWSWGVVAASALVAVPLWTGHSMFNVKDPAVAAGYTLITMGLGLAIRNSTGSWRLAVTTVLSIAAGVSLALGTRPGMWPGLAASTVVFAVWLLWLRPTAWVRRAGEVLLGLTLGYGTCLALYPKVFAHPGVAMQESFSASANYNDGLRDRTWLIDRVGVYVPTLIGLLALVGLVVVAIRVWSQKGTADPGWARWTLVCAQLLTFPIAAMVFSTPLDDDLRQLLFCLPPLALMAAAGLKFCHGRFTHGTWRPRVAVTLAGAAVVIPVIDSATLFPYNYLYSTPVADLGEDDPLTHRDNWLAGARYLAPAITSGEQLTCWPTVVDNKAMPVSGVVAGDLDDCRTSPSSPITVFLRHDQLTSTVGSSFLAISPNRDVPDNCSTIATINRRTRLQTVTTLSLWRCVREEAGP